MIITNKERLEHRKKDGNDVGGKKIEKKWRPLGDLEPASLV
jgi:hypothetical protein